MDNMKQEGREQMRRAEEDMRAARTVAEAVERLSAKRKEAQTLGSKRDGIKMSKSEALASIKTEALALQKRYPFAAPLFAEFVTEAAKPEKKVRKVKDTRPRWKKEHREAYNRNLHDWIAGGMSDREAAQAAIKWAAGNSKLSQYKTPSASSLEKWAAAERKLMARKRKRAR
ncbi:MAG: hypothetical protein BWX54_02448 [Verrucomicrobia bacterium ADurb.Bin018]|jgi:cell fate (sporulation/competence/biofilm development) regulator YmcA (YheA/YmcA/DUF963 family)|nr:MAG: hypothetical protein BWX54_02448 [Verrucomicrobia bacterium ADurb.Bin018]